MVTRGVRFPDEGSDSEAPRPRSALAILLLLQSRRAMTARELAKHLGVSIHTIYRDVDGLARAGVPLFAETGRSGGYRLSHYLDRLDPRIFRAVPDRPTYGDRRDDDEDDGVGVLVGARRLP